LEGAFLLGVLGAIAKSSLASDGMWHATCWNGKEKIQRSNLHVLPCLNKGFYENAYENFAQFDALYYFHNYYHNNNNDYVLNYVALMLRSALFCVLSVTAHKSFYLICDNGTKEH